MGLREFDAVNDGTVSDNVLREAERVRVSLLRCSEVVSLLSFEMVRVGPVEVVLKARRDAEMVSEIVSGSDLVCVPIGVVVLPEVELGGGDAVVDWVLVQVLFTPRLYK